MKHQSIVFGRVLLSSIYVFTAWAQSNVILVNFEAEARAACNWGCIVCSQSSAVIVNLVEELYTAYCSVFDSQESFFVFFLPVPECIWCLASFLCVAICVQSSLCFHLFLLSEKMPCVCVHMCACTSESVNTLCFNLRLSISHLLDHELFAERVLPKSTVFWTLSCLIFSWKPTTSCGVAHVLWFVPNCQASSLGLKRSTRHSLKHCRFILMVCLGAEWNEN